METLFFFQELSRASSRGTQHLLGSIVPIPKFCFELRVLPLCVKINKLTYLSVVLQFRLPTGPSKSLTASSCEHLVGPHRITDVKSPTPHPAVSMAYCPGSIEEILVQRKASAALAALQASSAAGMDVSFGSVGLPTTLRGLPRALSLPGLEPLASHPGKVFRGGPAGLVRRHLPREAHLSGTPCSRMSASIQSSASCWSPGLTKSLPLSAPDYGVLQPRTAPYGQMGAMPTPLGTQLLGLQSLGGNPLVSTAPPGQRRVQGGGTSPAFAKPMAGPDVEGASDRTVNSDADILAFELRESM